MIKEANATRVLFASSEAEPFYKVGGLGDYSGSLPNAISSHYKSKGKNVDIRIVIPLHNPKTIQDYNLKKITRFKIKGIANQNKGSVYAAPFTKIPQYFISQDFPPPESNAVYGFDQYQTAYKYAFFSLAVQKLIEIIGWWPDIIHTNDWHTALINHQVRHFPEKFKYARTLLTIHNMPFMGYGSEPVYKEFGIESVVEKTFPAWAEDLPLPMGISTADRIVAVSPTYAEELKTSFFAYGLENYFIQHREKITGIINGIDFAKWAPQNDQIISNMFSVEHIESRIENKKALFDDLGLDFDREEPLLVVISRLENQKGIDLILDALSNTANQKWKAIILGSGHKGYEHAFRALERVFPQKIRAFLEYNPELARKLYASGDMILMPSLYEPCGLSQMIAMRYGCVPVAHAVGGLKDSITTEPENDRTGYLFNTPTKHAFISSLKEAMLAFANPEKWRKIQLNGMTTDFSWIKSAESYADLYEDLLDVD